MSDPPTIRDTPDPAIPVQPNTTISNLIPPNKLGEEESAKTEVPEAVGNVTIHRGSRRRVKPIPPDVLILHGANAKQSQQPTPRNTPSPHRPRPQLVIHTDDSILDSDEPDPDCNSPEVTTGPGASSNACGKRGEVLKDTPPPLRGRKVPNISPVDTSDCAPSVAGKPKKRAGGKDKDKAARFIRLGDSARDVGTLDGLAGILSDAVATIRAYSSAAPTTECLAMLDAICDRLRVHHELLGAGDDETSFSTIVTRSVVDPVKTLTKQLPPSTSTPSPSTGAPNYAKVVASTARASPRPKPRQPPFTKESEERILVRFDGAPPPIFSRPLFKDIVAELNAYLVPLGLPEILFVQRQVGEAAGLFISPALGKEGVGILTRRWSEWAPGVLPGGRIIPVVVHCFLQVDAIPFAAAGSEEEVCKEFEERNPDLGKVNGWRWVNPPPSEGRISALRGLGRKPPTAGSMVLRLESRERVDVAVMRGRVIMAVLGVLPLQPYASTLQGEDDDVRRVRGRLTRSRLLRNADIAEELRLRAAELCEALDEHSSCRQQAN
ncbi:hypothetical protein C8F04DRAFT_1368746 [Mycena alexandri]|uniref:Uncharacterized protein n=1 Tax=Mycena alexandri TaxID=1745969 RepID=A0AAD6SLH8_9AGAR|nr:hypothetical protein C8F04DRAFT_1368746 [Mycena alexandri]